MWTCKMASSSAELMDNEFVTHSIMCSAMAPWFNALANADLDLLCSQMKSLNPRSLDGECCCECSPGKVDSKRTSVARKVKRKSARASTLV